MNANRLLPVLYVASLLATSGCGTGIPFLSTSTPTPTNTPPPTPTRTPQPTRTPAPKKELKPGIDTWAELGWGIKLLFNKVIITGDYYNPAIAPNHVRIHPGVGQTLLVIEGKYKGNMESVFTWEWYRDVTDRRAFYIADTKKYEDTLLGIAWSGSEDHLVMLNFIIYADNKGPYIFHDTDDGLVVDLSSLPLEDFGTKPMVP